MGAVGGGGDRHRRMLFLSLFFKPTPVVGPLPQAHGFKRWGARENGPPQVRERGKIRTHGHLAVSLPTERRGGVRAAPPPLYVCARKRTWCPPSHQRAAGSCQCQCRRPRSTPRRIGVLGGEERLTEWGGGGWVGGGDLPRFKETKEEATDREPKWYTGGYVRPRWRRGGAYVWERATAYGSIHAGRLRTHPRGPR